MKRLLYILPLMLLCACNNQPQKQKDVLLLPKTTMDICNMPISEAESILIDRGFARRDQDESHSRRYKYAYPKELADLSKEDYDAIKETTPGFRLFSTFNLPDSAVIEVDSYQISESKTAAFDAFKEWQKYSQTLRTDSTIWSALIVFYNTQKSKGLKFYDGRRKEENLANHEGAGTYEDFLKTLSTVSLDSLFSVDVWLVDANEDEYGRWINLGYGTAEFSLVGINNFYKCSGLETSFGFQIGNMRGVLDR